MKNFIEKLLKGIYKTVFILFSKTLLQVICTKVTPDSELILQANFVIVRRFSHFCGIDFLII